MMRTLRSYRRVYLNPKTMRLSVADSEVEKEYSRINSRADIPIMLLQQLRSDALFRLCDLCELAYSTLLCAGVCAWHREC